MNRLFWIIILLLLEGCATTSYEKCTKGGQADRFGSVDACVSTLEEERLFNRQQRADYWKSWSNTPTAAPAAQTSQPAQRYCTKEMRGIGNNAQMMDVCY